MRHYNNNSQNKRLAVITGLVICLSIVKICGSAKKNVNYMEEIDDIKEFKKVLRTRVNVLVLFAKSAKSNSKTLKIFNEAADELRGIGTVCLVDCSEAAKMCKKLKVSPSPLLIQHYKDGEFNRVYDRPIVLKSIMSFMRDPTGDIPWDEDVTAGDVVHVTSAQEFSKLISKSKKPVLAMFYAPWCGHCKRLKPEFAEAATEIKATNVMAGVDVDKPEMMSIRQAYNITGFPTLLYFENGKLAYPYGGENHKESLISWLKNPGAPEPKLEEKAWSDVESDVVHLTTETFDESIKASKSSLVMFYAPWCGHCKKMKPEYEEAAAQLKTENVEGAMLAAVDATIHKELGERFEVKGFPTVKYFLDGELTDWQISARTQDAIVTFMKNPQEPPPPPPPEAPWSEMESEVVHLNNESFQSTLRKKKHSLIMFYAPWCGHCKKAKPHFTAAAEKYADETKVMYGAVDCTEATAICAQFEVQGYPTFKYFNYGKNMKAYTGGREEDDFVQFMKDPANPTPSTLPPAEDMWKGTPGAEDVIQLTDTTFDQFLKNNPSVLVMFYAPWCGHCKNMKPAYAAAAAQLRELNAPGILTAVDATMESKISEKYGVRGFPTVKYFKEGSYALDFDERSEEKLVAFMQRPEKPKAPEPEDMWAGVPGSDNIHHLTSVTFDSFMAQHPSVLVMFYAPWCGHCKKIKPALAAAATQALDDESAGVFATVDCTKEQDLAKQYEVQGFPTLKYFKDGKEMFKYTHGRDTESLLAFIKNPIDTSAFKDEL